MDEQQFEQLLHRALLVLVAPKPEAMNEDAEREYYLRLRRGALRLAGAVDARYLRKADEANTSEG